MSATESNVTVNRRRAPGVRWLALAGVLALVMGGALWWWRPQAAPLVRTARQHLDRGDLEQARAAIARALKMSPDSAEVLVTAGEIFDRSGDSQAALDCFSRVPADGSLHAVVGIGAAGDLYLRLFRLTQAEQSFRRILKSDPRHLVANRRLAAVLVMAGRRRESEPCLFELLRQGECDPDELALLGNLQQIFDDGVLIEKLRAASPQDPLPQLAAARIALQRHDNQRAREILVPLIQRAPELLEARVQLGKALLELNLDQDFLEWQSGLPAELQQHPDVWLVRAQFAERIGDPQVAGRCYWEALRQDPNLWQANYQLAVILKARGDERHRLFLERANHLKVLIDTVREILLNGAKRDLVLTAARATQSLGRPWEAWKWVDFAARLDAADSSLLTERDRLELDLTDATPRCEPAQNPAVLVDLSAWPSPAWTTRLAQAARSGRGAAVPAGIRFQDQAAIAGVEFQYVNGDDWNVPGMYTWESFGGGVAVLDYDGDGWPDLHFTQGGRYPADPAFSNPADQLFRNLGTGRFANVTVAAGVEDAEYSQGVAAGDLDDDGFADLYVANIGLNRLYRNQGDGTFVDVTAEAGITARGWTSSCVIADFTGDGWPEIYDVTYLAGPKAFTEVCAGETSQEHRICPPQLFEGEPDRLYWNQGDGRLIEVGASAGILAPDSKGLGAVAADFELSGRLNLFVANDVAANFYFGNVTLSATGPPRFEEQAVGAGCAYNGVGRSQANMGIAVADTDGDGLLDLYISTFLDDYNTLFGQRPAGLFADRTSEAGLMGPGHAKLGFGTQFLDANLDGWPDLVVANGHVDDFRYKGKPFHMHAQFYAGVGSGRFQELAAADLGDYFLRELLGRGLARLDWNRDGHEDFAVSHLDSPAALVTNQSSSTGHFLALQLRGVVANRDAVGAVVWVTAGDRTCMQQITAGDGYYASNQKQLIFGLGAADTIQELRIRWPGGREQVLPPVAVDAEYLCVEGRPTAVPLPRPR